MGDLPPRRMRKLAPAQYAATLSELLPGTEVSAEALSQGISQGARPYSSDYSGSDATEAHLEALLSISEQVASAAVVRPGALERCMLDAPVSRDCVTGFAERAYRQPLDPEEADALMTFYGEQRAAGDDDSAIVQLLRAILVSPNTTYLAEVGQPEEGTGIARLTSVERASLLSYFIADGPPDPALRDAGTAGDLADPEALEAHARRLMASPRTSHGLRRFFDEHFGLSAVLSIDRHESFELTGGVAAALRTETDLFVNEVLFHDDGRWSTLLTAPYSVVVPELAQWYGLPSWTGEPRRVSLEPERRGLLMQGAVMASLAHHENADAVGRGKFIRERLLCESLPPPPPDVDAVPPPDDGDSTARERLARHSEDPSCASCHKFMDPLGLSFEVFDAAGRYRTHDNGHSIDPSGALHPSGGGDPHPFADAGELVEHLAASPEAQRCFAQRLAHFALGEQADECTVSALAERMEETGGDVREVVVALVRSPAFGTRKVEETR